MLGSPDGKEDPEGIPEGTLDGASLGDLEGIEEPDGLPEGILDGAPPCSPESSIDDPEDFPEGVFDGIPLGIADGSDDIDVMKDLTDGLALNGVEEGALDG